jgi:hypothetical protein
MTSAFAIETLAVGKDASASAKREILKIIDVFPPIDGILD